MSTLLIVILINIAAALFIGWICAWLGVAFVQMTAYYSIFGKIKFWFFKSKMNEGDIRNYYAIIDDPMLTTTDINHRISEIIYDQIGKRSWLMRLVSCHYCVAVQLCFFSTITYCLYFGWAFFPVLFLIAVSFIYFTLNEAK